MESPLEADSLVLVEIMPSSFRRHTIISQVARLSLLSERECEVQEEAASTRAVDVRGSCGTA